MLFVSSVLLSNPFLANLDVRLLAWEFFVSVAVLGLGWGLLRLLGSTSAGTGVALCLGFAGWLLLGGWLNLLQLATPGMLKALLLAGFLLALVELARPARRKGIAGRLRSFQGLTLAQRVAGGLVLCFFLATFALHLVNLTWNRFDDLQGYLAFADKAAALGGLQPDPFSERRVTSGLGGGLFLNATMLAGGTGNRGIDYLEGGLGLLALLLCLAAVMRVFKLPPSKTIAVYAATIIFTFGRANLTIVLLSAAMFLTLFLLIIEAEPAGGRGWRQALLLGLVLGGAFCLKSSNIPFCAVFLLLPAVADAFAERRVRPVMDVILSGAISVLYLLPWGLKHLRDEGTVLFPTLGKGDHLSAYGFPSIAATMAPMSSVVAALPDTVPPLLAAICVFFLLRGVCSRRVRMVVVAFLSAVAMTAPLFSVSVAGADIDRFLLPMLNLCALLLLMSVLAAFDRERRRRWPQMAGAVLFLAWVAGFIYLARDEALDRDATLFRLAMGGYHPKWYEAKVTPAEMAERVEAVRRAQQSAPVGAVMLEAIEHAYGFDWRRNRVYIADYPGMAGLPPGMPLDNPDPEALRNYLAANGVQYVMVDRDIYWNSDYWGFRLHPRITLTWTKMKDRTFDGYALMEGCVSNRTRDLLFGIGRHHRTVYDDGHLVVISLA